MALILVAEDDVDIRNLLVMALKLQNFEVIEAFDGQDALEKTKQDHPELLLLDIAMPHLNGFEVCEALLNDAGTLNIPVILISAKIDQEEVKKGRSLGVHCVIEKPFDFSYLVSEINNLIGESNTGRCL
jgi:two-component system, cell cycle response regulator